MGSITRSHSFVSGEKPTESEWNVDIDQLFTLVAGQLDTNNVDTTSSDGISVLNANQTVSGTRSHSGAVTITNDVDLIFGTDSDIKIRYDETTDDALRIDTGVENAPLAIVLKADQGDDAGDAWKVNLAAAAGVLTFGNDIASKGTYVTQLTLTPHATVASSTTAIAGHATVGGNLTVTGGVTVAGASAFDIGDSDKLLLGDSDDLTVYHDGSNSYITNATGALKIATETSGIAVTIGHTTSETTIADNATVTGTLAAGASTLASLVCTAAGTFGGGYGDTGATISTAGVGQFNGALTTDGALTAASLVCTAAATFGGGTGSSGATITTGGAGTFDGILKTEDATDATSTTDGSLQTDGGLSVAKDAILGNDVKLLTDSSVLSLGVGSDATLTHDGTTGVTIAANPVIVDSGDALTLDAHTGIFVFKDAGTEVLRFTEGNSGDVTVKLATNAKDLVFTDNGDATNMKILDAAAGINVPGEVQTTKIAYTDGDDAITIADGGGVTTSSTLSIGTVAAAGEDTDKFLVLDSSGNVDYRTGTQVLSDIGAAGSGSSTAADDISAGDGAVSIETTSGNITIDAQANDADVIIKVDDNGSAVTALTLDGSDEGNAIFVNDVQLKSDGALLEFGADLDTTLTHTDGTGLTLNSTNKLTFGDAASFIQQSADGTLRIDGEAIIDLNASTRVDVSGDLKVGGEVQTAGIGYTDGDNAMTIADGGAVTFAADAYVANGSGLVVGNTAQVATNTLTGEAQIQGTTNNDSLLSISRYSADGTPPRLHFAKSRNATIGNVTGAVQSGDDLGSIGFCGSDGTDFNNQSASIGAVVSGSVSGDTVPVDLIFNTGTAATERMRLDSAGNMSLGYNSTASAAFTNTTNSRGLLIYNSDDSASTKSTELTLAANAGNTQCVINFTEDITSTFDGQILYDLNADDMYFKTSGNNTRMQIDPNGRVGFNVSPVPTAYNTLGVVIDQKTGDDGILTFKSTGDVAHAITDQAETATYGMVKKLAATAGGVEIKGLSGGEGAVRLAGFQTGEQTSDTDASNGSCLRLGAYKKSGSNYAAIGSTGNIFAIDNADTVRLILKGNGDMHITNTTLTALDEEDDIGLVRAFQKASSKGVGLVMSKWDAVMKENEDDLRRVGVLSSESDFVIQQNFNSLIGGSVWQLYTKLQDTKEFYENKIAALESRLMRLEN